MRAIVRTGMQEGAWGLSSGPFYFPQSLRRHAGVRRDGEGRGGVRRRLPEPRPRRIGLHGRRRRRGRRADHGRARGEAPRHRHAHQGARARASGASRPRWRAASSAPAPKAWRCGPTSIRIPPAPPTSRPRSCRAGPRRAATRRSGSGSRIRRRARRSAARWPRISSAAAAPGGCSSAGSCRIPRSKAARSRRWRRRARGSAGRRPGDLREGQRQRRVVRHGRRGRADVHAQAVGADRLGRRSRAVRPGRPAPAVVCDVHAQDPALRDRRAGDHAGGGDSQHDVAARARLPDAGSRRAASRSRRRHRRIRSGARARARDLFGAAPVERGHGPRDSSTDGRPWPTAPSPASAPAACCAGTAGERRRGGRPTAPSTWSSPTRASAAAPSRRGWGPRLPAFAAIFSPTTPSTRLA